MTSNPGSRIHGEGGSDGIIRFQSRSLSGSVGDSRDSGQSDGERMYVPFQTRVPWKPDTVANPRATGTLVQDFCAYSRFRSAPSNMPL